MGANLRTFAIRHAESTDVRQSLLSWLSAKGFELSASQSLFVPDPENSRNLVLSSNDEWTIVAFSHSFEEGDRLVFELKKLCHPVLEVWVFDSDIWGYRVHDADKLAASFNSKPTYFGGTPELELPDNGDPRLLCDVCDLTAGVDQIQAIQRRRAVFSESIAESFCELIGAEPASLDYRDFEELSLEAGQIACAGGFQIERLDFQRRTTRNSRDARQLHDVPIRAPSVEQVDPEMAAWQAQFQRQMLPLTIFFRVLAVPLRVIGWLVAPLFSLWWRWRGSQQIRRNRLLEELLPRGSERHVERQGEQLVNRRHRCRITLPEGTNVLSEIGPDCVFRFELGETGVQCQAIRPAQLAEQLKPWPGSKITYEENTFVNESQARIVQLEGQLGERFWQTAWYLVQTPQAIYRFQTAGEQLPDDALVQMREIHKSFRVEDTRQVEVE